MKSLQSPDTRGALETAYVSQRNMTSALGNERCPTRSELPSRQIPNQTTAICSVRREYSKEQSHRASHRSAAFCLGAHGLTVVGLPFPTPPIRCRGVGRPCPSSSQFGR